MKGSFFLGGGRFEVREMGDLAPGPGEVRVRVAACGVCGTCRDRRKAFAENGLTDPIEYETI